MDPAAGAARAATDFLAAVSDGVAAQGAEAALHLAHPLGRAARRHNAWSGPDNPRTPMKEKAMSAAETPDTRTENFGVPWEEGYGYVQAIKRGDTIYLSGQLSHDGADLVAPAPLDEDRHVRDHSNMREQMEQTYRNAEALLGRFGASLAHVVEEVLYVLDVDAAFAVAAPVRKAAYGREDPQVASTLVGTPRLAFPEQLIEIKMIARV
jgi:enamine deaminase RidA (YjgF/YER057c/UK114 family)